MQAMTPFEDSGPADATERQLAAQLEQFDELLRSGSMAPADLAARATVTLPPDAQDRLRRARFALRRLKSARPMPSLVPTFLPGEHVGSKSGKARAHPGFVGPARAIGATVAEREAQALLARRLRFIFAFATFYLIYMLFVSSLRRLEALNFSWMTVLLSYWHYRLFTVAPPSGFEGPPHEVWLLYVTANVQLIWILTIMAYGLFVPQTPWRCAVLTGILNLSALAVTLVAAIGNPVIAGMLPVMLLEEGLVLAGAAALCVYSTLKIQALESQVRAARQEVRELGQYTLGRLLGAGGMGEVYLAEHRLLKRPCAVKLIQPQRAGDSDTLNRFEREVQATARLSHPNVVEVFDYGRAEDGTFFYVMEYLSGLSLDDLVRRHGAMPPARAVHILRQVCGALREAHTAGLVHRDIKPGNVIVCDRGPPDRAKLLDFGLVRNANQSTRAPGLTGEWGLVGTPGYMAPEQIEGGQPIDARGDLYSLGAVAYYLLTGRAPFDSGTVMKTLASQLLDAPTPLRTWRTNLPDGLEEVVMRCLEPEPAKRYADAAQLDRALARYAGSWTEDDAADWWRAADTVVPVAPSPEVRVVGSRAVFDS
jgi:hypothetical protein